MRVIASLVGLLIISACVAVPEERIANYEAAYAEMRQAAEEVYVEYGEWYRAQRQAELETELAQADVFARFDMLVPASLTEPPRGNKAPPPKIVTSSLGALEAGSLYNEALAGLASGESVAEVQASVAAVAGTLGAFAGAPIAGQVAAIIAGEVAKARRRAELVASLTRTYTIEVEPGERVEGHLIDLLLDLLIADVDDMFQERREADLAGVADILVQQGEGAAQARTAEAAARAEALRKYRELLVSTKEYFEQLRDVAANPEPDVQAAVAARHALDLVAQARVVISLIHGA